MTESNAPLKVCIYCVGNKLMLDDGLGTVVYEELTRTYDFPENVEIKDVGCMGMDMLEDVRECDYMITIDAVDGTGHPPGTVFEFEPEDMARHSGANASLHELTLVDLFDAALLLGYESTGKCFGMQVVNISPAIVTIGLTQPVYDSVPLLVDAVLADLVRHGINVTVRETGERVAPPWHHVMSE